MPTIKTVEGKIQQIEKFRVAFMQAGKDVRSNRENIPQYTYSMAAPNTWTVAEWKSKRFKQSYPGYDVNVYAANGMIAIGQMTLENVRNKKG